MFDEIMQVSVVDILLCALHHNVLRAVPPQPIFAGNNWAMAQWGAETLALLHLTVMMRILMAHTITEVHTSTLLVVGANLFILLGKFNVGAHRLKSLGISEHILCYFMIWNLHDVFHRFVFVDFLGHVLMGSDSAVVSMGAGILCSVQSGERHHYLTKLRMRIMSHDRYRWHRFAVQEDCRVFGGYRFEQNLSYLDDWLSKMTAQQSHIIRVYKPDECQGCGRAASDTVPSPWPDLEPGRLLNLVPPLCRGCWLRLLVRRKGVGECGERGFKSPISDWHSQANRETADLMDGDATQRSAAEAEAADDAVRPPHDPAGDAEAHALAAADGTLEAAAAALAVAIPGAREAALAAVAAAAADGDFCNAEQELPAWGGQQWAV